MGKNIVVRLHVYLMCFLLAFAPAYSYASAAPLLDFTGLVNGAKVAGGYVADFWFKRAANDPIYNAANDDRFVAKAHTATNNQLAKTWMHRWFNRGLGLTGGVAAVAAILEAADWVLDPANNTITKVADVGSFTICGSSTLVPNQLNRCSPVPKQALELYYPKTDTTLHTFKSTDIASLNAKVAQMLIDLKQSTVPKLYSTQALLYTLDFLDSNGNVTNSVNGSLNNAYIVYIPPGVVHATEDDIAAAVAQAPAQALEALATPYLNEPHAAATAAAAKAQPAAGSDACPSGQTKVNGVCQAPPTENKCPAGQTFDTTTGKCKAATAAQCPVGQVYDPVQKKCMSPKLPDDEDDWPEFCEWAAPVCDFIEWAKQDVDKFDVSPVDVKDTAADAQSITSQILTLGYVSGGIKACPANYTFTFAVMGQGIDFDLSYKPLCDMLLMARPVVIAIAYFQAAKIVFVGRRD